MERDNRLVSRQAAQLLHPLEVAGKETNGIEDVKKTAEGPQPTSISNAGRSPQ